MTRLTDDIVKDIIGSLDNTSDTLKSQTGMDIMELSCKAIGLEREMLDLDGLIAGVVPVTSGLGIIKKFSESVAEIVRKLGMDAFVTDGADVNGMAEALSAGAEMVFMADDIKFLALNTKNGKHANNSFCTAAGYTTALNGAAKGLSGKDVLVLGAGRVGSIASELMVGLGANVTVYDINEKKTDDLSLRVKIKVAPDVKSALSSHSLVFNAAPAAIDGRNVKEGTIFSSPGIPYPFDEEGLRRAKMIIHDPLDIGASVMAIQCASFSRLRKP